MEDADACHLNCDRPNSGVSSFCRPSRELLCSGGSIVMDKLADGSEVATTARLDTANESFEPPDRAKGQVALVSCSGFEPCAVCARASLAVLDLRAKKAPLELFLHALSLLSCFLFL